MPSSFREIRVFASFDVQCDTELYDLLREQAAASGSRFTVSGGSKPYTGTDDWREKTRREIREADQVVVVCGESTDTSIGVFSEIQITREELKPHFLLWGRRESMCTKPAGTPPSEGMYSWTRPILLDQIDRMRRKVAKQVRAEELARLRGQVS